MVHPFVTAPIFVSVTPSMGVLFPILRRNKVYTLWSSFFLSFMCFANCILYLGYSLMMVLINALTSLLAHHPPEVVENKGYRGSGPV
jgi:predicted branched-subunit amino acid permease